MGPSCPPAAVQTERKGLDAVTHRNKCAAATSAHAAAAAARAAAAAHTAATAHAAVTAYAAAADAYAAVAAYARHAAATPSPPGTAVAGRSGMLVVVAAAGPGMLADMDLPAPQDQMDSVHVVLRGGQVHVLQETATGRERNAVRNGTETTGDDTARNAVRNGAETTGDDTAMAFSQIVRASTAGKIHLLPEEHER